jgi:hypothetical protein
MPVCPQCNREFAELSKECPSCKADLTLLLDHTKRLGLGLEKAEEWTKSGELGRATWAYLAVLEVDPDNPKARRQISRIATAIRQFDRTAPKQRWSLTMEGGPRRSWLSLILVLLLLVLVPAAFLGGFFLAGGELNFGDMGDVVDPQPNNSATGKP